VAPGATAGGSNATGSNTDVLSESPSDGGKNWMGIAALVSSSVGAGLVGIVLGHLGLRAARRGQATNRGIALAGTIVGYASIVIVPVAVIASGALAGISLMGGSAQSPRVTITPSAAVGVYTLDSTLATADRWFGLATGDCVLAFDTGTDPTDLSITKPEVVPCTQAHYGEVYAIASISGDAAPDDETFRLQSREVCAGPLFTSYVGVSSYSDSSLYFDVLYPTERSWQNGTHQMVCLLVEKGESTTGSLKASAK
jgi:hypothetical protein